MFEVQTHKWYRVTDLVPCTMAFHLFRTRGINLDMKTFTHLLVGGPLKPLTVMEWSCFLGTPS